MVQAYLRGLLKPTQPYGIRSFLAEDAILEALSYESEADTMQQEVMNDFVLASVINPEDRQEHVGRTFRRADRLAELRALDIYRVGHQLMRKSMLIHKQDKLSTYQLYQIAEQQGVFDLLAIDDDIAEAKATPLL